MYFSKKGGRNLIDLNFQVVIHSTSSGIEQTFECGEWLEQTKNNSSQRRLNENKTKRRQIAEAQSWVAKIFTSEMRGAGKVKNYCEV